MGERRFVVNASPLIFLSHIDALPLLGHLATEVRVPVSVRGEVLAKPGSEAMLVRLDRANFLRVEPDLPLPLDVAGWDLGAGESQVLAHALTLSGCEAVLDDLQARSCARSLGIPVVGTLGILLRAKKAGLIAAARPLVEELLDRQLYLSRNLVEKGLAEVGE